MEKLHSRIVVYRYTPKVQKYFGLKTKPEPWLHVAYDPREDREVVFVWDTRQVLESKRQPMDTTPGERKLPSLPKAKDSRKPLRGHDSSRFNELSDF